MCGCHKNIYQDLRHRVGRIEDRFFRGRHIFPRDIWLIRKIGAAENAYRHGTLLTNWANPCEEFERRAKENS